MWDLIYTGGNGYRLALYSPLGTLEACLAYGEGGFTSCGGRKPVLPQVLRFLPPSLLARLPLILLGHPPQGERTRDNRGRTIKARITVEGRPWTIIYRHYLATEGTPYPTLVLIRGEGETLRIRVEEMVPNWTPSAG